MDAGTPRRLYNRVVRPFLKWAGGKRQLLPRIRAFYPASFGTYHEPFLGSGAVFFDLVVALGHRPARLTDENPDLIGTWLRVRDSVEDVLCGLEQLARGHEQGGADHYWTIRDRRFNPRRAARASRPTASRGSVAEPAGASTAAASSSASQG